MRRGILRLSSLAKQLEVGDSIKVVRHPSGVTQIKLNRPQNLNALTIAQTNYMHANLTHLASEAKLLLLTGEGDRAFCAGGDVLSMKQWAEKRSGNMEWFGIEYALNQKLSKIKIPIISVWKGVVMGGGVGLSIYGSHRVSTDSTVFAMPEVNIGFIPDVGASFFLPRLTNAVSGLGLYLAMTGERLFGSDALRFGLATHHVPQKNVDRFIYDLCASADVNAALAAAVEESIPPFHPKQLTDAQLDKIRHVFGVAEQASFETLWSKIKNSPDFKHILSTKCPLTVRLAFELYKLGSRESETLASCLDREFKVSVMLTNVRPENFIEGVTAQLVHKGKVKPNYQPPRIEDVTEEMVLEFIEANSVPKLGLVEIH
jgi:enoyl-CoA hydratase